jgi:hypothetical protein
MVNRERGQELHGRACRGENLSAEERAELETWYAAMDAEEAALLNLDLPESPTNEELRARIRARLGELQATLEDIHRIEERNAELRRQNAKLKQQLVAKGILAA